MLILISFPVLKECHIQTYVGKKRNGVLRERWKRSRLVENTVGEVEDGVRCKGGWLEWKKSHTKALMPW